MKSKMLRELIYGEKGGQNVTRTYLKDSIAYMRTCVHVDLLSKYNALYMYTAWMNDKECNHALAGSSTSNR